MKVVENDHCVLPPSSKELSLIGTGYFLDQRRLSCQLLCFGDITVDVTEQIEKANEAKVNKKFLKRAQKANAEDSHALNGILIEQDQEILQEISKEPEQRGRTENRNEGPLAGRERQDQGNRNQNRNRSGGGGGGKNEGRGGRNEAPGENRNAQNRNENNRGGQNRKDSNRGGGGNNRPGRDRGEQSRGGSPRGGQPRDAQPRGAQPHGHPPRGPRPEQNNRPEVLTEGAQPRAENRNDAQGENREARPQQEGPQNQNRPQGGGGANRGGRGRRRRR